MNIFKRVYLSLKQAIFKDDVFKKSEYVIKYAFTSGGVKYYQFDDVFNIPYRRGLEAIHAYDELAMKCDRDYLERHQKLVHDILNGDKITMNEWNLLNQINDQLKQRLEWVVVPDHIYRLASVVFFDASENPANYEISYAKSKIEHWKKSDDIDDFFLRKPIVELLPFLRDLEGNLAAYFRAVEKVNHHHYTNLYTGFGETAEKKYTDKQ